MFHAISSKALLWPCSLTALRTQSAASTSRMYSSEVKVDAAPAPPKRPGHSYSLFLREMFAQSPTNPDGFTTKSQEIAQKWKSMAVADKSRYTEQAKRLHEQYKHDLAQYRETYSRMQVHMYEKALIQTNARKLNMRQKREILRLKPKKQTAWTVFQTDFHKKSHGSIKNLPQLVKEASAAWRVLDIKSKATYQAMASRSVMSSEVDKQQSV